MILLTEEMEMNTMSHRCDVKDHLYVISIVNLDLEFVLLLRY